MSRAMYQSDKFYVCLTYLILLNKLIKGYYHQNHKFFNSLEVFIKLVKCALILEKLEENSHFLTS